MSDNRNISVIGLGYVGISIVVAFGKMKRTIGFDINPGRITELKNGHDRNEEVSDEDLKSADILFTTGAEDLKQADFHIITVPTPVDDTKHPDFSNLFRATEMLGKQLKKGDIVVYESTVYPGATEEKCIPLLERVSKLVAGKDFFVGYSPERINPSDKEHTFQKITKIVSAMDEATLEIVAAVYESVVKAGVHRVSSIRVAEATKVVENTQRDLNISLINEIALIMHSLGMDITEVLNAAKTKWNFIPYQPGLVGGHCIGVNSYYLAHKSEEAGYYPILIHAGRRVNDLIPKFIARETIKKLIHLNTTIKKARIGVLGFTYKENCSDYRDTKIINLIKELSSFDTEVLVHDPIADSALVKADYDIQLVSWDELNNLEAIILAVSHKEYLTLNKNEFSKKLINAKLIMDVKGILDPKQFLGTGINIWQI
jgi:UDP-N-acetyl-D-glucosamine/UDP-N-acetyl-D-galactosamine dehydrogenase